MSQESLKEKDIAGKKVTIEKCAKTGKSPPTNENMEKSRDMFEKFSNVHVQSAAK